jgi:hypothetical protein
MPYEQLAIFMLPDAPEAHDACRKIAIALIDREWYSFQPQEKVFLKFLLLETLTRRVPPCAR